MSTRTPLISKDEARERLLELLSVGDTVYCIATNASRSGMSRHIRTLVIRDNQPRDITYATAALLGYRISDDSEGMVVGGAGMDMGFHVVYSLSRSLFPKGHKCIGDGWKVRPTEENGWEGVKSKTPACPSNDHSNDYSALTREMPETWTAEQRSARFKEQHDALYSRRRVHNDGGYALKHKWL